MISLEKLRSAQKPQEGKFVPFRNIKSIPKADGVYQIWTKEGGPLKVDTFSFSSTGLRTVYKAKQAITYE